MLTGCSAGGCRRTLLRIVSPRDNVEPILPVELRGDVEVLSPNQRFEMEYRINGKPEAGELFYLEREVLAFFDWPPDDRFSPTGVVRKAIESGDLKQKAEEAPPVSPEPATPNDKPASAPATGAEVLAEFPVGTEQAQSVVKPTKPKRRTGHAQMPADEPTHPLFTLAGHYG